MTYISDVIQPFLAKKCTGPFFSNVIAPQMPNVVLPLFNVGFKCRDSIAVPGRRVTVGITTVTLPLLTMHMLCDV